MLHRSIVVVIVTWLLTTLVGCGVIGDRSLPVEDYFTSPTDRDLAAAVAQRDEAAICRQLAAGANPEATGVDGVTMLQFAILAHSRPGVDVLLAAGVDPDRIGSGGDAALHLAAFEPDPVYLDALLAVGADPDVPNTVTGETALKRSILTSDDAPFHRLLAAHADPSLADRNDDAPLHNAARLNRGDLILDLLRAGADPRAKNNGGASFQDYYFAIPEYLRTERVLTQQRAVIAWLDAHHVRVDPQNRR